MKYNSISVDLKLGIHLVHFLDHCIILFDGLSNSKFQENITIVQESSSSK